MDLPFLNPAVSFFVVVIAFLSPGEACGDRWQAGAELKGGEAAWRCSWEDEGRFVDVEDSRLLWRGGDWSGILGQGSLGAWKALRRTPPYGPGARSASPWSGNARFIAVGTQYRGEEDFEIAMVMAKEKPQDSWVERKAGYFGVEAGANKIAMERIEIDSSIGLALAEAARSNLEEGWSARKPPGSRKVLHMGVSTRIGMGAVEFEQWAMARKDLPGGWDAAISFGFTAQPRLGQGIDFLVQAHIYGCGEGFRTLEGALPQFDRALEIASQLAWRTLRIKGLFRSLSLQGEADSPETSRIFDPSASLAARRAWLWKTDVLQAKLELAAEKGARATVLRCSASLDSGGLAWATAEACIGMGLGVTGAARLKADFGLRFARLGQCGEDETWLDEPEAEGEAYVSPSAPRIEAAELQYLKLALSCAWPGLKPPSGVLSRAFTLGSGRVEIGVRGLPWAVSGRGRELSLQFTINQKAILFRDSSVEIGISSPEGGYTLASMNEGWSEAFPDLRLALSMDR